MNFCSSGHAEIVHAERYCPLCQAKEEIEELEGQVESLQEDLKEATQ